MSEQPAPPGRSVLVAEDNPIDLHLLRAALDQWGYRTVVATEGETAWKLLQQEDAPRLVILDWTMPRMNGIDLCRAVRGRASQPYVYLLMVTGRFEKEEIIHALDAGADDCLTKPFVPGELHARLRVGERILQLQNDLLASQEALRYAATHDALTGLLNRAAVLEMLERELARAGRAATSLTVAMGDVDHFKRVNDTHGHAAGDAVLREVARRLVASTRIYDTVGRYGGEEFLILLPGCDVADALNKADQLREVVAGEPVNISGCAVAATLSLGVTVTGGAQPLEAEVLLLAADTALYRAKASGRNRVEFAQPSTSLARSVLASHTPTHGRGCSRRSQT